MMPEENSATYRILDASLNRASEGLRTLEELARFGLDDPELTKALKSLRHGLTDALSLIPREALLRSRDTDGDVGTLVQEPSEYKRSDLVSVLRAASARVQQSLRVLEECCKTIDSTVAGQLEQIRYRCYTVASQLETTWPGSQSRKRLEESNLYVLTDAAESTDQFAASVRQLVQSGVDILQLRDHSVNDRTLIERGRVGTKIARENGALFIMNDRADLALAADCDGVHIGQDELPVPVARRIVGDQRLIGVSTHNLDQAHQAVAEGANYIGCGPVFAGNTKQFDHYVGTDFLKQVATEIRLPSFAIGGIDVSNVNEVIASGIRRIAVTGAVRDASDPNKAIQLLKQMLSV